MAYSRTAEKLMLAKRLLMEAYKVAGEEGLPETVQRQIDALAGRAEGLQNKIEQRGSKPK
ncbi:hypothetical protein EN780_03340 [Mesorhizobium sp. M4B.F.Ca.ET.089.01.1.1]|uniref:hypothetical protein n=1 Tax=Mesorhizobium sp. M4B.F.Ca.ET.089.01.1.1 TaxID=2496662 RepID=UPI000FE39A86|nr:hypothetical protein [Mesorhizobium sp. M4B.F.Ca.ET.089.01.1.1]RWX70442.1 hypothetical protein EN780_03340 [Mesorhizobium sp. M4B.F.Ca.ET.089.01.1.1]TIX43798.1 MAG: hypothetical protein E5V40_01785 [Mesorhizobium sp.]